MLWLLWIKMVFQKSDTSSTESVRPTYTSNLVWTIANNVVTPASSILITTTDTRMAKPVHLAAHHTVEMAWWLADPAIQFRITGQAYTIPNDTSASDYDSQIKDALKGLRAKGDEEGKDFWESERKRLWKEAMSGHLRASFGRPPPGTPLSEVSDPKTWPESLKPESVSLPIYCNL